MIAVKHVQPVVSSAREHDLAVRPTEHGTGALRAGQRHRDGRDSNHCPHAKVRSGRPSSQAATGSLSLDVTG